MCWVRWLQLTAEPSAGSFVVWLLALIPPKGCSAPDVPPFLTAIGTLDANGWLRSPTMGQFTVLTIVLAALFTSAPVASAEQGPCDSNYSRACVPVDSDVDCAGGSGNGPSYVQGPVQGGRE